VSDHTTGACVDLNLPLQRVAEAFDRNRKITYHAVVNFFEMVRLLANDDLHVSGLEARYYVRGAMACRTQEDIDALVYDIMTSPGTTAEDEDRMLVNLLVPGSRSRVAAAAIRGYVSR
jgi:hypothetical protein